MDKRPDFPAPSASLPSHQQVPISKPVAIYYRQSTDAQVGNVATAMQTTDMEAFVKRLGWTDPDIILIDVDKGISGATKIDERPGMSQLFDLVTQNKIQAVACQDEDRLFRDFTQIQTNIFIEACRKADVQIITPLMTYDFANEFTGPFHARQFRFKSEMAAEYINSYIRGRLHRAKRRLMFEGRWAGGSVPIGYMVDMRKVLPDGSPNPEWRHYVPFQPYAEVITEYFRRFLDFSGHIRSTVRDLHENGPFLPNPAKYSPPEGFKFQQALKNYGKGYSLGRTGISTMATNAAYVGHWTFKGNVIHWNHHEPLIDEQTFLTAFNYLSDKTLAGKPNANYQPKTQHLRPSLDAKRPVDRPLYAGLVVSQYDGSDKNVGTNYVGREQYYAYTLYGTDAQSTYIWSKAAKFFDKAVSDLLHRKLLATFDEEVWQTTVKEFSADHRRQQARWKAQLVSLEQVMTNILANLEHLEHPEMVRAMEKKYTNAQDEHQRLSFQLDQADTELRDFEQITSLKHRSSRILSSWPDMTRVERRSVVDAFIEEIVANPIENNGLKIRVGWRDKTHDTVILPRQATTGTQWLTSEAEELRQLVEEEASQLEIAKAFPTRDWRAIRNKYYNMTRIGIPRSPKPIKDSETFIDFLARSKDESLDHMTSEVHSERARPGAPG